MLPDSSEFQSQNVQMYGYVFQDTSGPNLGQTLKTQWCCLNENCTNNHLRHSCGKDNWRRWIGKKYRIGNVFLCIEYTDYSLSVCVDHVKMAGKNWNMLPMWRNMMKIVDLVEPTSFLEHVNLGCIERECKPSKNIVEEYRTMFESRISAGATEKLPGWEKLHAKTVSCFFLTWKVMRKSAWKDLTNWQKKEEQLYKVSTPCLEDHNFQKEELESIGESSKVCSQSVLKCWYLARIGRPDILRSVNKLARSVTKWTEACDSRPYIHHTSDYRQRQHCHVGSTAQHCRLGLIQDCGDSRVWWKHYSGGNP